MPHKGRFVFAVAGQAHSRQAARARACLKRLTRRDILLGQARSDDLVDHDEIINMETPPGMTDRQAGIFLKTGLSGIIGDAETYCYLDSDVIAVSPDVDEIFSQRHGPIAFAADHASIDMFSRYAVRCFCATSPCTHLRDRMEYDFGIRAKNPDWTMWNGGVFVCGPEAGPFMRLWHELVLKIFKNPLWQIRDQGARSPRVRATARPPRAGAGSWRRGSSACRVCRYWTHASISSSTGSPGCRSRSATI